MVKFHSFILLAAAAVVAVGVGSCNKDATTPEPLEGEICFGLDSKSIFGVETSETKATSVELSSFSSFNVTATKGTAGSEERIGAANNFENIAFSTSDDPVTASSVFAGTSTHKFWPLTDQNYHFYASNLPMNSVAASGIADVTVTVANNNTDLVTAYRPYASADYKQRNTLAFNHAYARLSTVTVTANDATVANNYTISNVTVWLINAKTHGTVSIKGVANQASRESGDAWSAKLPVDVAWSSGNTPGAAGTQLYTNAGSIAPGASHTGSDNDLYLVPGDYTLACSWTASKDDYTQAYTCVASSAPVHLTGGKINSITTTLSGNATEVEFTVSVAAWGSNSVPASFPVAITPPHLIFGL